MANRAEVRMKTAVDGLKPEVKLRLLPPEVETLLIDAALEVADGDAVKAKKLLLKINFELFGRTWGESLFVPDERESEPRRIWLALLTAAQVGEKYWTKRLVTKTAEEVLLRPYDLNLYVVQLMELGGEAAVALFKTAVADPAKLSLAAVKDASVNRFYQSVAGRSFWEMTEAEVFTFFRNYYGAWDAGMKSYETLPDFAQEQMGVILTEARRNLRLLVRVILGRRLVTDGLSVGGSNKGEVEYRQLIQFLN